MDTLIKLFGNSAKVKVIKLFVFNPDAAFDVRQISERTKEGIAKVRKEVLLLEKMDLIKRKVFYKNAERKKGGKKFLVRTKTNGWTLNAQFESLMPLQQFLVNLNHLSPRDIARKLQKAGTMKLVVVSGVFIQQSESRVDLLVVGDNLKKNVLDTAIKTIEAEMGKEIRFAVFETPDFQYRLGLYDKLLRDILDFPHEKIVNRLSV
jgi:S-adenosylmethionine:tRNA-ribosyltransferase-isomerase (queuine synthetase)